MGRPLNKKYFGNRNVGSLSTAADNGIGGEGLAAYTLAAQKGSLVINATYPQPTLTIPAPNLPRGVQATAQVVWEVESVTVTNGLAGHGYTTGVTTLTGLDGVIINVATVGSGQGEVQTVNFTGATNRGEFTTIPRVNTTYQIVGGDGNQQTQVKFRVKSITTVEKGSGYTAVPTISWTVTSSSGTMPGAPTVALTTDSGGVSTGTNQENAIIAHAKTTTGGSDKVADIIKQESSTRYLVQTADGVAACKLVATTSLSKGDMYILATDTTGSSYYVTKLTAHKAHLTRKTSAGSGWTFATGSIVRWTLGSATSTTVKVENA